MAERDQLLRALKQVLKLRGMRYSDLARGLGVSEPPVKRMLSTGRIDLARLERICGLLDIHLFALLRVARGARPEREHPEDRKSCVSVKRVTERGDPCGWRNIKKK